MKSQLEQANELINKLDERLTQIADTRGADCLRRGCTCVSDVAFFGLKEISEYKIKNNEE